LHYYESDFDKSLVFGTKFGGRESKGEKGREEGRKGENVHFVAESDIE
jgi:hypothetical protein